MKIKKLVLSLVALLAVTMSNSQVTNVAALTIGSTGTNVTSTVANSTTTPVITLSIPNAHPTVSRGLITNTTQSISGAKTFTNYITASGFKVNGYPRQDSYGSGFLKADGTIDDYNYVQQPPSGDIIYTPYLGKASYIPKYYDLPNEYSGEVAEFRTMIMDSQIFDNAASVGIGTTTPDEKLSVNGKIHTKEVRVDLIGWAPDYVFQKYYTGKSELKADYKLPTLAEIERFTKENHHLPNVPSAKEIQEKGLQLGEMSNMLLQKIEELTIYVIEQQKEIVILKKENENYRSLSEKLSAIEKELKK
jgi:hypothetical protein